MKRGVLVLLCTYYLLASCNQLGSKHQAGNVDAPADTAKSTFVVGRFSDGSPFFIDSLHIIQFFKQYPDFIKYKEQVIQFYSMRSFQLAWHDSFGKIEAAQILLNRVMQSEENGLSDQVLYLSDFKRLSNKSWGDSMEYVDLMQTSQYVHFAHRVVEGLPAKEKLLQDWYIPQAKKNYSELLAKFIAGDEQELEKMVFPQFFKLRKALRELNKIQQRGGWIVNIPATNTFRVGDSSTTITTIKKRLQQSDDWTLEDTTLLFTTALEKTIRLFQEKHGLDIDGMIGKQTIKCMNSPVEERIKQVIVNMERCKWIPYQASGDYVIVNIPSFSLAVMQGDSLVLACDAIVGKETNRTAIFKGMMKYVVFNPYWNVPDPILKKEIIPALERNRQYLIENHMEWYDGRLRQKPGADNALGAIKFVFPNPFDIYLHDTPSKGLFKEKKRAFSHGCIRIAAPHELATYLLRNQKHWSPEQMKEILARGKEHYVKLDEEVPVYVFYLTAFVDFQGNLNFREDIYQKDPQLLKMLFKN